MKLKKQEEKELREKKKKEEQELKEKQKIDEQNRIKMFEQIMNSQKTVSQEEVERF